MIASRISLVEINLMHQCFWSDQRKLVKKRMGNRAVRETAFELLETQQVRDVPISDRTTLEQALEDADRTGRRFLRQQARKGGLAGKTDALQLLIEKIVARRPEITVRELEQRLRNREAVYPIQDIADGMIAFTNNHGDTKEVPLSGLKDRLYRAKKKIRSR